MKKSNRKTKFLKLIKTKPYIIGHWLGFRDLEPLHNEWIKKFMRGKGDLTLLAHRGSYKTTCISVALTLMLITDVRKSIIFIRKTDTDVVEIVKQVAKMLMSPVIQEISKEIWGVPVIMTTSSVSEINTNLNLSSRGVSQLIGLGIGTSMTGKHADYVFTDDIVNRKDRVSRAERESTKQGYMELQNIKNRDGRIINTGTPWHKEDAISEMPNVVKYDCYETGLMSQAEIDHLRGVMTPSLFAANYELKHIADADAMFTNPQYTTDESMIFDGIAHIDAAYGGKDGTAFTILKSLNGKLYVFGKRWNRHVDDCLDEILAFHRYYRAGTIYNEIDADKGYLAKEIMALGVPTSTYKENENKYIKIATKLRRNWRRIVFLEGTDSDYMNEILDYTEHAEHDDAPDSLASLIRVMENIEGVTDDADTLEAIRKLNL